MATIATFNELLDAVERLPLDEQADLVSVIQRRLAERGRRRVVGEVAESRAEFEAGQATEATVDDILREIDS